MVNVCKRDPKHALLRPATPRDLQTVASWITNQRDCELWAGWRVSYPIDAQSLPAAIEFAQGNAFSLVRDAELAAFGQLLRKNGTRGHVARLIVNPALRGRGYGEALVRTLLDEARRTSLQRVSLNVEVANIAAVSLYAKIGFIQTKRPPDEVAAADSRYMETMI